MTIGYHDGLGATIRLGAAAADVRRGASGFLRTLDLGTCSLLLRGDDRASVDGPPGSPQVCRPAPVADNARMSVPQAPAAVPAPGRSRRWRVLVPVVCLLAGLLFAVSARTSGGTDLRAPGIAGLADTVRAAEKRVQAADQQAAALQRAVNRLTGRAGAGGTAAARARSRLAGLTGPGGLTPLRGAGLEVVLDDASSAPAGVTVDPNELLVHQSDLQAVVNALWAGGAEAMTIAGQRVIATSAVRCVGPTLLLNGQVFSPPYRVAAIGPARTMQEELAASPGVQLFQEAAGYYGLGYTVQTRARIRVPGYTGALSLDYARAGT